MKIVFFISGMGGIGGAQRVVSNLYHYFKSHGHSVKIITTNNSNYNGNSYSINNDDIKQLHFIVNPPITLSLFERIKQKLSRIFVRDKKFVEHYYFNLKKSKELISYLKTEPADVIFSFMDYQNIIVGMAAKKINAKIIMAERSYPDRYSKTFTNLRNRCYNKADYCVFQTKEQMAFFPQTIQRKSVVIYNPIKDELPEVYHDVRKKVIVTYCRLQKQKNIPLLIKAFSKVANKYNEYRLEIYGYGELQDELQSLIDDLNLTGKVSLLPFDPDIHNKIVGYSMFVMTSDYEGMPNSLIEAMAIGLPVISTDCDGGGAKAVIENGVNGILVPKGDVNAVAAAMEELIEHPEKAEFLSKNAVKIREQLAVEKIAAEWLKLAE